MIRRILIPSAVVAALVLGGVVLWGASAGAVLEVAPGTPVEGAADHAGAGGVVRLLAGRHGPFEVRVPGVTVEAAPGAVVRGPIEVWADDVTLRDLRVVGGENGVTVRGAEGVTLEGVSAVGAELHGIEVIDASVAVRGCRINGLRSPYAQGVEIRNSSTRPRSVVEGCTITGGQEGLLTHSSRVEFRNNLVTGTTLRAIKIGEMGEGVMEGNVVRGVLGIGLFCVDWSRCEIVGNDVRDVAPDAGMASRAGYAVVGWYYAVLRVHDNTFDVAAPEPVHLTLGAMETDRFPPMVWAPGWRGALPAVWVAALSMAGLVLVRAGVTPWVRRLRRRPPRRPAVDRPGWEVPGLLLTGFVIQSFHMLEHYVQVWQVYVVDGERRSGLLGARIDTEWVHFAYNALVLAFLVWAWRRMRPGSGDPLAARVRRWAPWLLAAVVVQTYHLAEHVAKMAQHLATGVDPAPGIFGKAIGLVWFHFGINLAVYAGLAIPMVALIASWARARRGRVPRVAPRRALSEAGARSS